MFELAQQVATFLGPSIPFLVIGSTKAAEKAGELIGSEGWEKAKAIWGKLRSDDDDKLEEIAKDLVFEPEDIEAKQDFLNEIVKVIENNPDIATDIASLMKSRVVQKVLAEQNSSIKGVRQNTTGGNNVSLEVIARDNSNIEDVEQKHNA